MAILNYTTKVPVSRTIGEIHSLLVRKGARSITSDFAENGKPSSVTFVMILHGLPVRFQLPCNVEGVHKAICRARTRGYVDKDQSERIAWRILKDWVEAQIALVESSQAEMAQVFMPYAVEASGQTMFQLFEDSYKQRALTAG